MKDFTYKTVEEHEKTCSNAEKEEETKCHSCKSWYDLASVGIPFDMHHDDSFLNSWCAPFNDFYCTKCIAAGKAVTLPHYSNPTSEEQVDFVDSDLVNMDPTKLRALLNSKCDCQLDVRDLTLGRCVCRGTPNQMTQKIMEIRRSTAAANASATIKPQPFSPISSLTSSISHSKPVSSPHSDIIPMALEQVVAKKGKLKRISRSQLGSMP